jgi:hypothetical protein
VGGQLSEARLPRAVSARSAPCGAFNPQVGPSVLVTLCNEEEPKASHGVRCTLAGVQSRRTVLRPAVGGGAVHPLLPFGARLRAAGCTRWSIHPSIHPYRWYPMPKKVCDDADFTK